MDPDHAQHHIRVYVALLLIIALIVGAYEVYTLYIAPTLSQTAVQSVAAPAPAQPLPGFPADAPPPVAADQTTVQQSFQYLVSFDGTQFSPSRVAVQRGDTIRFANNSSSPLVLSSSATTSPSIEPGGYWQFTDNETQTFNAGNAAVTVVMQ